MSGQLPYQTDSEAMRSSSHADYVTPLLPSYTDNPQPNLHTKAFNPDNAVESAEVLALLEQEYGEEYPYHEWYNPDRWSGLLYNQPEHQRATGIVLLDDDSEDYSGTRVVGHLAYRLTPALQGVEVFLPALACDQIESTFAEDLLWRCVRTQALRQHWHYVYTCTRHSRNTATYSPLLQHFPSRVCAVLPSYDGNDALSVQAYVLQPENKSSQTLYVEASVRSLVEAFYKRMPCKRNISTFTPTFARAATATKRQPTCTSSHAHTKRFSWYFVPLYPKSSGEISTQTIHALRLHERLAERGNTLVVAVGLGDTYGPEITSALKTHQFLPCGILPAADGRDQLLFTRTTATHLERWRTQTTCGEWLHAATHLH